MSKSANPQKNPKDKTIDYSLLVNPYKSERGKAKGRYRCIVTRRMETPDQQKKLHGKGKRSCGILLASGCKMLSTLSTSCLTGAKEWRTVRNNLNTALCGMHDNNDYVDTSHKVFITPRPKDIKGLALEMILPFKYHEQAINKTLELIEELAEKKNFFNGKKQFFTAPLSIRFVGKSKAYLSPFTAYHEEGDDASKDLFVCIEIPLLVPIFDKKNQKQNEKRLREWTKNKWEKALNFIQFKMMKEFQSSLRIHWGLNFGSLNIENYNLADYYPHYSKWLEVYDDLNGEKIFSNEFTDNFKFDYPKERIREI